MHAQDMLIKLYAQTFDPGLLQVLEPKDIRIRKPIGPDRHTLLHWAGEHFPSTWVSEIEQALCNRPSSCFIAQRASGLLGFAAYDATALGYLGPVGVIEEARGLGIGRTLVRACMLEMRLQGYGYAIVGMAGAPEFFRKVAGAIEIPGSSPGLYTESLALRRPD